MHKRLGISIATLAALLLAVPNASASTEAGWSCVADATESNRVLLAAGGSSFPMPPVVPPEGPKVITGWAVEVGAGIGPLEQRLEVFEIRNEESEYEKIGESATQTLAEGENSFSTRIPVDEGDSVGLYGATGTLACDDEAGAVSIQSEGSVASGETRPFTAVARLGTPVRVRIENDRDGDGYGDETQDGCPLDAGTQEACPLKVQVVKVAVRPEVIVVKVRPSARARIEVSCRVELPSRGAEGGSLVRITAGPPRTAEPKTAMAARMRLPAAVRRHLRHLPRQQVLRATLTVRATDRAKRVTRRKLTLGLKGSEHG